MTKEKYIAFAKLMVSLRPEGSGLYETGRRDQWRATVDVLEDFFASERPQFDRQKWQLAINK